MNQTIQKLLSANKLATDLVLAVLSGVSAYFTYQGAVLALDQDSAQAAINTSALIFATGVSAALFLFWRYALGIVPIMPTNKTRRMGMAIIGLGCMFIVALSSWMNVMALAGAGAFEAHMRVGLKQHDAALTKAYVRATAVGGLVSDLDLAAKRYRDLADSEIRRGALTGAAGAGGVSDSLLATQKTFGELASAIRNELKRFEDLHLQGRKALTEMEGAITGNDAIETRRSAFSAEAAKVAKIVGELGSGELTDVIARTMRGLEGGTGLFSTSISNGRLAKAQNAALQRISDELAQTGERIAKAADAIGKADRIEVEAFERIGVAKAVVLYAGELLPYWAGGMGLDLMPVVLIMLLMLFAYAMDGRNVTDPDIDGMSFGQVRKVIFALREMEGGHVRQVTAGTTTTLPADQKALPAGNGRAMEEADDPNRLSREDEAEWEQHIKG
ncbi:hypothetical protein TH25_21190 [Thalassospira profundimaris]|uniref:Uncharacterized protein n=1 Tax=Thalassospira profundimaris TaxID=502049 RepID=A0A367WQB2_9PROT|nr:hypothetical protein [Thalassospira profundimaris]RCK43666.1 hypothetical protein TH25_21190 [Thalassospira profundimaris]